MKTQVIQLDVNDDVNSARDKMSWVKTERILLVFPRHASHFTRNLDLRLLQRHATLLGAQLAVVSDSDDFRRAAEGLAIPTFSTASSAERQKWEGEKSFTRPQRRSERPDLKKMHEEAYPHEAPWRSIFSIRFISFSLAVIAILTVLSLFIPSATIQLNPATKLQSLTFRVSANPKVGAVTLSGSLPAKEKTIVVEKNKTIKTTGSVTIADTKAEGMARFRNLTSILIGIPVGTVISTQNDTPIQFETTSDAVVAAGFGETVEVAIQAVNAGSSGNLPKDVLTVFESDLGTSLSATNPEPTLGGSDRLVAIATVQDRLNVHEALMVELLEDCKTNIQKSLDPDDLYFPDTLEISQILFETYFPAEGQSGEALSLTMRLQCHAQYASQEDIQSLAVLSLNAGLPEGFTPLPNNLKIQSTSNPFTDKDGITHWEIITQRSLQARIDSITAIQLSMGLTPSKADLRLKESLQLANNPIIKISPDWWPWLPSIPLRININTGN